MIRFEAKLDQDEGVSVDVLEEGATISELAAVAMAARDILKIRMKEIMKEEKNGQCN